MIRWEKYRLDPCGTSSLSFWKSNRITPPAGMLILHDRDFDRQLLTKYEDTAYFKLLHDLQNLQDPFVRGITLRTAGMDACEEIARIINHCYADMKITQEQVRAWREKPVYQQALWIMALDENTGEYAGCVIADLDGACGEVSLEWVQVMPAYRRRGIGRMLVTEALKRARGKADFATVSGKVQDPACPEKLYRACGFRGQDVWHVLTEKK